MAEFSEKEVIARCRGIILLLDKGNFEEAAHDAVKLKAEIENKVFADADIPALCIQTSIATSNPSDAGYVENLKDELNRITFKYFPPLS